MQPKRRTSSVRGALIGALVITLGVLLLGLGGTAAAAAPSTAAAAASTPAAAASPRTPSAAPAAAAVTPAVVTPLAAPLSPLEQLWQYLRALFQQILAWFFPPPPTALPLPYTGTADQVITVVAPAPGASTATVTAWSRSAAGWAIAVGPVQAEIGPAGVGQASEATSVTPAGVYSLTQAFGRQANPGTRLSYYQTDRLDWWNENPASPGYNTHVRQPQSPGGNSENLYDAGAVYDYAVNIDYNTARVPGAGSAFFLHVTNGQPTAGCVAVPVGDLIGIMRWLDPAAHPVIDIDIGIGIG